METENQAGVENQNDASVTAPESGTAPDSQGSENTLLTSGQPANQPEGEAEKASGETEKTQEKAPEETVPEKYEFTDVGEIIIDDAVKEAFSGVARELGLSQEKAQGVLDKMAPAIEKAQQVQLASLSDQWKNQSLADSEFGGEKFQANLAVAKKALDQFASPQLQEILVKAGLGNHPEVIRVFYRVGNAISGDRIITGKGTSGETKTGDVIGDMADRMYKN